MNMLYTNFDHSSPAVILLLVIIGIWSIVWKVYALWTAAKHGHKRWFVALVILNTLSILEIIYIFYIAKKSSEEVRRDFKRAWAMKK